MAAGEQGDEHLFDHLMLAHDDLADFLAHGLVLLHDRIDPGGLVHGGSFRRCVRRLVPPKEV